MDIETPTRLAEIRRLNDQFRTTFRGGEMLLTQSVSDLPPMVVSAALEKVAAFTDFNKDNDPHGEHDSTVGPGNVRCGSDTERG